MRLSSRVRNVRANVAVGKNQRSQLDQQVVELWAREMRGGYERAVALCRVVGVHVDGREMALFTPQAVAATGPDVPPARSMCVCVSLSAPQTSVLNSEQQQQHQQQQLSPHDPATHTDER